MSAAHLQLLAGPGWSHANIVVEHIRDVCIIYQILNNKGVDAGNGANDADANPVSSCHAPRHDRVLPEVDPNVVADSSSVGLEARRLRIGDTNGQCHARH
jgi:hypothetical protein